MKRLQVRTVIAIQSRTRRGTTLAEVLMSLGIMAIGVVSLATLFPISALRVLEATNLTNSAVARFNAEGMVDSYTNIIHFPNGPQTGPGPTGNPPPLGRNYIVDPLGWYELQASTGQPPNYFEYNRPTAITYPILTSPNGPLYTRYLGENPATPGLFTGIDVARALVGLPDTSTDVLKENFPDPDGTNAGAYVLNAENRVSGLTLSGVDLTVVATEPSLYRITVWDKSGRYSETRMLTSVNGTTVKWDLNGNGSADYAGEDLPLPPRYTVDVNGIPNVGRVRIDLPTADYSWLLTVRKRTSGPANVDVVVFRKRDFSQLSEQYYLGDLRRYTLGVTPMGDPYKPGIGGADDNNNGIVDDAAEVGYPLPVSTSEQDLPNNRVSVDWTSANYPAAPATWSPSDPWPPKPPIRKGGYIFDPVNALWYRVQGIEGYVSPAGVTINTAATLILETAIALDNTEDVSGDGTLGDISGEDLNNNGTLDRGGLIIPKGVVAVFPLETKIP